jgi:diguanylate cyclase (GGDEF)-like protein/PAS domain S-box-containing protein
MNKVISLRAYSDSPETADPAAVQEMFNARLAALIGSLAVLLLVFFACFNQREQVRERENERAANLARAFEFHVHHELQSIDDLLRQMRQLPVDSTRGFDRELARLRAGELGARSIQFGFIGPDGVLRHASAGGDLVPAARLAERDFFRAHLDPARDQLFIGRSQGGGHDQAATLQFSRRFLDARQGFAGVVVISMPGSFLTDGAAALGLRPNDVATLLSADGYLLSRTPVLPASWALGTPLPAAFLDRLKAAREGIFETVSPVDQVNRLIAFRRTIEFPVVSVLAPTTQYRDVEFRAATWRNSWLAATVVGLLLAFHLFLERSLRRNAGLRREKEEQRQHLENAQSIAHLGSWRRRLDDPALYCSDEVYRIFGLLPGERAISFPGLLAAVHADDRAGLETALGRAREQGLPYEHKHRIVRPDGEIRHVIERGQPAFGMAGRVDEFTGTVQDVTEATLAELRLQEAASADRLARAVFHGVLQPMLVLSAEGRLLDVNQAFEDSFGVAAASLRGRLLTELEATPACAVPFASRPSRLFLQDRARDEWEGDVFLPQANGFQVLALSLSGIRDASGRIEHYVGIYTDVTQRKQREDDALYRARHDPLTELPNRQYAMERLGRSLHRSRRKHQQGVLIFIDLDRFKEVNDAHGHEAGDEVLRVIARRFQTAIRQEDMAARLGGDEFVVLIEEVANLEVVRRVAEALRAAAAEPVTFAGTTTLRLSASFGIAVYPRPGEDAEHLLARADQAMYEAKRDGRDAIRFFADDEWLDPAAG